MELARGQVEQHGLAPAPGEPRHHEVAGQQQRPAGEEPETLVEAADEAGEDLLPLLVQIAAARNLPGLTGSSGDVIAGGASEAGSWLCGFPFTARCSVPPSSVPGVFADAATDPAAEPALSDVT